MSDIQHCLVGLWMPSFAKWLGRFLLREEMLCECRSWCI